MNNTNTNTNTNLEVLIEELENTVENVSRELESIIGQTFDEENPIVKLYRALGNVSYVLETNEIFCHE